METFWQSKHGRKSIRLLSTDHLCLPKMHGGLNIHVNCWAHERKMILDLCKGTSLGLLWCVTCFHIRLLNGILIWAIWMAEWRGCFFVSWMFLDWKEILSHIKWDGRESLDGNSLHSESLHWLKVFVYPLPLHELRCSYFIGFIGIRIVGDVLYDNGPLLSFPIVINWDCSIDSYGNIFFEMPLPSGTKTSAHIPP